MYVNRSSPSSITTYSPAIAPSAGKAEIERNHEASWLRTFAAGACKDSISYTLSLGIPATMGILIAMMKNQLPDKATQIAFQFVGGFMNPLAAKIADALTSHSNGLYGSGPELSPIAKPGETSIQAINRYFDENQTVAMMRTSTWLTSTALAAGTAMAIDRLVDEMFDRAAIPDTHEQQANKLLWKAVGNWAAGLLGAAARGVILNAINKWHASNEAKAILLPPEFFNNWCKGCEEVYKNMRFLEGKSPLSIRMLATGAGRASQPILEALSYSVLPPSIANSVALVLPKAASALAVPIVADAANLYWTGRKNEATPTPSPSAKRLLSMSEDTSEGKCLPGIKRTSEMDAALTKASGQKITPLCRPSEIYRSTSALKLPPDDEGSDIVLTKQLGAEYLRGKEKWMPSSPEEHALYSDALSTQSWFSGLDDIPYIDSSSIAEGYTK
jgi:hypothetical protein